MHHTIVHGGLLQSAHVTGDKETKNKKKEREEQVEYIKAGKGPVKTRKDGC